MKNIVATLRYGLRQLVGTPTFTVTAVLTLAIGIGANAAIFSVIHGVLLRPLPFPESEQLVGVWHSAPGLGFDRVNQCAALYFTQRDGAKAFEDIAMWNEDLVAVTGDREPEQVEALWVTDGFFPILRAQPIEGRAFTKEDDLPDTPLTAVLSYGYWQKRFGGNRNVIGQTLTVDGHAREIVGVLPQSFRFLSQDAALFLPIQADPDRVFVGMFNYMSLARLKPGATLEEANAEIARSIPVAAERFPGGISLEMLEQARFGPDVHPLKEDLVGDIGKSLWVVLGTVGLVLLIACANVANLFLVRSEGRFRELAVRAALGASRAVLARMLLLESLLLGLLAGVVGIGLAAGVVSLLKTLRPENLPRIDEIGLDPIVLAFALGLSVLAGLLFGAVPLLHLRRERLARALQDGNRSASIGRDRHLLRGTLVVVQVMLALVLLTGAGLLFRSLEALRQVKPGFEHPEEVLTFRLGVPSAEVEDPQQVLETQRQILDRLAALPGVENVAASSSVPMDGNQSNDAVFVKDFPTPEGQLPPVRRFKFITAEYFETLGNALLAGRTLNWQDIEERRKVLVVSENLAREYWGEPKAALGQFVATAAVDNADQDSDGGSPFARIGPWREIVGVVANEFDDGPSQKPPTVVYWPLAQEEFWGGALFVMRSMVFTLRTELPNPARLLPQVREAVWSVNRNLPLANVRTLDEIYRRALAPTSFLLLLLTIAAGTATLLGCIGLYGVLSYILSQRTREIGVRMALGAQRGDIANMMVRYGAILGALGVTLGCVAAFFLSRLMSSLLFGVARTDLVTYGTVALILAAVALLTSYLAGHRASALDPIEALRVE